MRASLRVHDGAETPSTITLKQASTIAEIRSLADGRVSAPLGLDGYFRVNEKGVDLLRASKGRWLDETNFQIVTQSLLEGIVTTSTLTFRGDQVEVNVQDNRGVRGRFLGTSEN